jgi:hypothetical protein
MLAEAVGKEGNEELLSVADQLIEQGRNEGLRDGRQEGLQRQRRILLKQLGARFGTLPEAAVCQVNAAEPAELETWAERVLTAPTLADVLGDA